ncbi:hypothetical protein VTH82DRAFT_1548 [Thermothelomyces myriococcoides]
MSAPTSKAASTFYLNLSTTDVTRASAFYTALGLTPVKDWSDESTATFLLPPPNQTIAVMLHAHKRFREFIRPDSDVVNAHKSTEALFSITCENKETVDKWLEIVDKEGGKKDPFVLKGYGQEMELYSRSWADLDGHIWECVHIFAGNEETQAGKD